METERGLTVKFMQILFSNEWNGKRSGGKKVEWTVALG